MIIMFIMSYFEKNNTIINGWNLSPGGDYEGNSGYCRKGIGGVKKGNVPWNKGKKCPEISESMRGRIHSPETRKKMSEAKRGKPSPKKGSKISEEQKAKISASLKARNQS